MSHRLAAVVLAAAVASAAGCVPAADGPAIGEIEQEFVSGTGPTRGHEDITRFAVGFANDLLSAEYGGGAFYLPVPEGEACFGTSHPLLAGDCATDWADDTMSAHYGVPADDFATAPLLQRLHFLRNYWGDAGVEGARQACEGALDNLVAISLLGMTAWEAGDTTAGLYWFGHALHTIQDSFATPHATREGVRLRSLVDVCSYGREVAGVCYHPTVALGDRIWLETWECTMTLERPWDCLTPEAQIAALASAGYLRVIGRHIHDPGGDLAAALQTWMDGGPLDDHVDYFHCETLPGAFPGQPCVDGIDCLSGHCADGVCCDAACDGECAACDVPGSEGTCLPAAAGTACALCTLCDADRRCEVPAADDAACGEIDCSELDGECLSYADVTAERCLAPGACKPANTEETCTSWVDLCGPDGGGAADAGAGVDGAAAPDGGSGVQADGGLDVDAAGEPGPDPVCACAATGRSGGAAPGVAAIWLLLVIVLRSTARDTGRSRR